LRLHDRWPLALEGEGVASLPASLARAAVRLTEAVSLAQTARRLAGRGEAAELTVLVHRVANPLRLRVTTDSLVGSIDHDNFVEFKGGILANPVRVHDTETGTTTANTLLSDGLEVAGRLQVVHTVAFRLSVSAALGNRALATTTTNSNAVDAESLGSTISKAPSLVGPGGLGCPVDTVQLAVLPATNTQ